jgi:soluble lytic murein transglycosylase
LLAVLLLSAGLFLFPLKHMRIIERCGREYGVPAALVCGVINRESRFRENAVSGKGAAGLMQIMPATAAEIAGKLGISSYNIKDPETNIRFGCFYLASLIERFGDERTALAAYNAGAGNVGGWLGEGGELDMIPFPETRKYVSGVMSDKRVYEIVLKIIKADDYVNE